MTHSEGTTKRCPRCGITKPMDEFALCRSRKDGRQGHCSECKRRHQKAWYAKNQDEILSKGRDRYWSDIESSRAKCREYALRHIAKDREGHNAKRRARYEADPIRHRQYAYDWRARNPEKTKNIRRANYERNAEKRRAAGRAHYWANRERKRELHREWMKRRREHVLAYQRAYNDTHRAIKNERTRIRRAKMAPEERYRWQRTHPLEVAERSARYRARRRQAPQVERINRKAIIERDGSSCYLCGRQLMLREITLDHVVPLARGGPHTYDNLRVCCQSCNSRKGTRLLSELNAA